MRKRERERERERKREKKKKRKKERERKKERRKKKSEREAKGLYLVFLESRQFLLCHNNISRVEKNKNQLQRIMV